MQRYAKMWKDWTRFHTGKIDDWAKHWARAEIENMHPKYLDSCILLVLNLERNAIFLNWPPPPTGGLQQNMKPIRCSWWAGPYTRGGRGLTAEIISSVGGRRDFKLDLYVHLSPLRLDRLVPEVGGTVCSLRYWHHVPARRTVGEGRWTITEKYRPEREAEPGSFHHDNCTKYLSNVPFRWFIHSWIKHTALWDINHQGKVRRSGVKNISVLEARRTGMGGFGSCPELFILVAAGWCLPVLISGCDTANPHHNY